MRDNFVGHYFIEIRPPPANSRLTLEIFVFEMAKVIKSVSSCWRSDLAILKFNLARSGFLQQKHRATPFFLAKTNSSEAIGSQQAMLHLTLRHSVEGCRRVRKPDLKSRVRRRSRRRRVLFCFQSYLRFRRW